MKLIKIFIIILGFVGYSTHLYSANPDKPYWFYNNITQHLYCAGCTSEDDNDSMECDGWVAGVNNPINTDGFGSWYLYSASRVLSKLWCGGCVAYITDPTPTFWFNIVDSDGEGEVVYYEFEIDDAGDFTTPVIHYRSPPLTINSEGSIDTEFTVGQAEGSGYYNVGSSSTALTVYGVTKTYYWRVKACDTLSDNLCNPDNESTYLFSGGNRNASSASPAFGYAPYFINVKDGNDYYTSVGAVTGISAKIAFATPYNLDYQVAYGTDPNLGGASLSPLMQNQTGPLQAELTGLTLDTVYYYQLRWKEHNDEGSMLSSPIRQFRTARAEGRSFRFVITSDLHHGARYNYRSVIENTLRPVLTSLNADFWVDLGDFVETDFAVYWTQDHARGLHVGLMNGINRIAHSLPFIPIPGNHELINHYYGQPGAPSAGRCLDVQTHGFAQYQGEARMLYYPLYDHGETVSPDYKTFFSWEWGDALFIALDPYLYTTTYPVKCLQSDGFTLGDVQTAWFTNLINYTTKKWIFVFIHQNGGATSEEWAHGECYGRGGAQVAYNSMMWNEWINKILYRNSIVFQGHDHVFSTNTYEGLRFFTLPDGGVLGGGSSWHYDERFGYSGEDWIYKDVGAGFYGEISSIDYVLGQINLVNAHNVNDIKIGRAFRNFGQTSNRKRMQRKITSTYDNETVSVDFGTNPDNKNSFYYVHDITDWEAGDELHIHQSQEGIVVVDVDTNFIKVKMLDLNGDPIVFPPLYDRASEDVEYIICSKDQEDDSDSDGIGDACDNCWYEDNPDQADSNENCPDPPYSSDPHCGDCCEGGGNACVDGDEDGIIDGEDNCPDDYNPLQEDNYPPQTNGCGDACECKGDFNSDGVIPGAELGQFAIDYGRENCTEDNPCKGDFNCDGMITGAELAQFAINYGREDCPICPTDPWCVY